MRPAGAVASARRRLGAAATTRRSVQLFQAFRVEQSDPDLFYSTLAQDAVAQISSFAPLAGRRVLDVGGGPGYFRTAFTAAGADYLVIDPDPAELQAAGLVERRSTVMGSGTALPIATGAVDLCFSSNVLEHVAEPTVMADEMVRVTRPGGLIYLSYTLWLSPWGGHETSPWHFLGGELAGRRYERRHGRAPKHTFGETMFALSAARMLRWADAAAGAGSVEVLAAFPRYLPRWVWPVLHVPGLREFVTWNLVLVLRRR